jgi:drug/metabolite transporter (DMT)-like permease
MLGEAIEPAQVMGGAAVLAGVALTTRPGGGAPPGAGHRELS